MTSATLADGVFSKTNNSLDTSFIVTRSTKHHKHCHQLFRCSWLYKDHRPYTNHSQHFIVNSADQRRSLKSCKIHSASISHCSYNIHFSTDTIKPLILAFCSSELLLIQHYLLNSLNSRNKGHGKISGWLYSSTIYGSNYNKYCLYDTILCSWLSQQRHAQYQFKMLSNCVICSAVNSAVVPARDPPSDSHTRPIEWDIKSCCGRVSGLTASRLRLLLLITIKRCYCPLGSYIDCAVISIIVSLAVVILIRWLNPAAPATTA